MRPEANPEILKMAGGKSGLRAHHIALIMGEPTLGRVASRDLGQRDIDCVYHFALCELRRALNA